jgi:hypothetical protein
MLLHYTKFLLVFSLKNVSYLSFIFSTFFRELFVRRVSDEEKKFNGLTLTHSGKAFFRRQKLQTCRIVAQAKEIKCS